MEKYEIVNIYVRIVSLVVGGNELCRCLGSSVRDFHCDMNEISWKAEVSVVIGKNTFSQKDGNPV